MEPNPLDQQLVRVAVALYDSVGTDVAQDCKKLLLSGDLLGLVSKTINPDDYTNPHAFRQDYACVSFLKKIDVKVRGANPEAVAVKSFWEAEALCAMTNAKFSRALNNSPKDLVEFRCFEFLERAKKWLADVLGPIPSDLSCRFGPGATLEDRGKLVTVPDKMTSRPTVTQAARDLLPLVYDKTAWFLKAQCDSRESDPKTVRGNRFTTVNKDCLKKRGICIEPSINIFPQLAVGNVLKSRIRLAGVDLLKAQDLHRSLAKHASRTGCRATVDLSNASDTVAYRLVKWLIPPHWFALLDCLRSPVTDIKGKSVFLQKFSSMGNGFTFELETLIFASICFAAGAGEFGRDFFVFGDDIIVGTEHAGFVLKLLQFCGFVPNERKTFVSGPFRESCGGDFFDGVAVRPHFVKENPTEPQHWIGLANGIRRMAHLESDFDFRYCHLVTAWQRCLDALPTPIRRLRGPRQLGDLVIHDYQFKRRWRSGIGYVRAYRPVAKILPWHHWRPGVVLASALYGAGETRGLVPRDPQLSYKVGYVPFS